MRSPTTPPQTLDTRVALYRTIRLIALSAVVALSFRFFCAGIVRVESNHMEPVILAGDRVITGHVSTNPLTRRFLPLRRGAVVIYTYPHTASMTAVGRIIATDADTIALEQGGIVSPEVAYPARPSPIDTLLAIPPHYSPRDNMEPFVIPSPSTTINLAESSLRDFIFYASMIVEENRPGTVSLVPRVAVNDSIVPDFDVADFALYRGPLAAVPDSLLFDWFFWDRLREHLLQYTDEGKVSLRLTLVDSNGNAVTQYRIRSQFVFIIGDNWTSSFDSRHVGPVALHRIQGRARAILWSARPGQRVRRLGRIIR